MSAILIKGDPDGLSRVPPPHQPHKLTDERSTLACQERPAPAPGDGVIAEEEIKPTARPLLLGQDWSPLRCIASATVGLDEDRLDVKEQQDAVRWQMAPDPANTAQN